MWYAVYTKARFEKKVEASLLEKDINVYLPTIKKLRQWKDRKKWVDFPLFSNYVFVDIDFKNRYPVLETNGVSRIITFGGKPVEIPQWQIDAIKRITQVPETLKIEDYLPIGKRVIVEGGPFHGLIGVISEKRGKDRLIITLESIQQSISVDIHPGNVKPLH